MASTASAVSTTAAVAASAGVPATTARASAAGTGSAAPAAGTRRGVTRPLLHDGRADAYRLAAARKIVRAWLRALETAPSAARIGLGAACCSWRSRAGISMQGLAKAAPSVSRLRRTGRARRGTTRRTRRPVASRAPSTATSRRGSPVRVPCSRAASAQVRARHLLHAALLLIERDMVDPRGLRVAREAAHPALREISAGRAIGHSQTGMIRRHRHGSAHQSSRLDLAAIQRRVLPAASEVGRVDSRHRAVNARIAIRVGDIHVVDDARTVERAAAESAVIAAAPPGMEHFKRSQRNPADAAESETNPHSDSPAPSEESDQSRRPVSSANTSVRDTRPIRPRPRTSGRNDTAPSPRDRS